MNSFIERESFLTTDIDKDDNLLRDGDAPFDEIIQAYHHFTRKLKLWPRPTIPRTRWSHTCLQGENIVSDGEEDCEEIHVMTVELRDFNDNVLAVYEFPDNGRMRLLSINKKNKNIRS